MNNLFTRVSTYLMSGLASQGATFLLWLLLPWYLTPSEIGYVSLALFAVDILTMLSVAGMDAAIIRFAVYANMRDSTFAVALTIAGISFIVVSIIAVLACKINIPMFADTIKWVSEHYFLVLCAVATNVLWNLYQAYQVAARQSRQYAIFQLMRAIFYLAVGIVLAAFHKNASVVLAASSAATATVFSFFIVRNGLPFSCADRFRFVGQIVAFGLPLILNSVLGVIANYTQRLVVDHYADVTTLGIYGFYAAIIIQLNGFWASFNKAWTPEYYSLVEDNPARALKLLQGMMSLICTAYPLLLATYVVIGESFLNSLIFNTAYLKHVNILYLLLLAPIFCGIYMIAFPLYYYDYKTIRIVFISVFLAAFNILISIILIQRWGILGASNAFVVQSIVSAMVYLTIYRGWVDATRRLTLLVIVTTSLILFSGAILITSSSPLLFVVALILTSITAWIIAGTFIKPLLYRLIK